MPHKEINPTMLAMVSVCTRSMSYSMFRRHAPSNAYLAFSGPGRQPEEQPQNFDQRRARNLLKTPAFAKPNRFGRGSLGKRQKPFRDRKSALRQSLRFGRLQQTPLKLGINSALWERRSGFATGNWRRGGDSNPRYPCEYSGFRDWGHLSNLLI